MKKIFIPLHITGFIDDMLLLIFSFVPNGGILLGIVASHSSSEDWWVWQASACQTHQVLAKESRLKEF